MGAPKSAVGYHRFETEDIALALVEEQRARWIRLIELVRGGPGTGLEQLLTILLSAAIDARRNPAAAAAARLLSSNGERPASEVPASTLRWRGVGSGPDHPEPSRRRRRKHQDTPGDRQPHQFTASFGLFTAENNGFEENHTEINLRRLWLDLLPSIGVPEPASVLDEVHVTGFLPDDPNPES